MPCVCAALCVCETEQPWGVGNAQNGECSHSHAHRFREERKKPPHGCEYKSAHPKGIFASAWLDVHLFRQSGTSSRILANNVSSASFSFCWGSSHFLFLDSVIFTSVTCCHIFCRCVPVCLQASACARAPLPGNVIQAYLGKCVSLWQRKELIPLHRDLLCQNKARVLPQKEPHHCGFYPAIFSESLPTFLSDQKYFFVLWSVDDTNAWAFFFFPVSCIVVQPFKISK